MKAGSLNIHVLWNNHCAHFLYVVFNKQKGSAVIKKLLESAIANAENNKQLDIDKLFVREAFVGKSLRMKRWRPRAKGRAGSIIKPFSKITIILEERTKKEEDK